MIISNTPSLISALLSCLNRMGIIKTHYSLPITIMQSQGIFNTMRTFPGCMFKLFSLNLYPIAPILCKDFTIKIEQVIQSFVFTHNMQHYLILIIG